MIGRLVLLAVAAAAAAGAAVFGRRRARQKARAQRRAERQAMRARLGGAASAASPAIAVTRSTDVKTAPPAAAASESGPDAAPGGEGRGEAAQLGDAFIAIRGIGPAMEGRLRASGVTSVAQIAAWSDDDIEAIAPGLKVKPERIRREAWVDQAKAVVAGNHAAG
jgi:predicted flap endonuclease-1-like 5' DNA nuclease